VFSAEQRNSVSFLMFVPSVTSSGGSIEQIGVTLTKK
jgi:hypothetical protein